MAQLSKPFNPSAVQADERSFEPLPAGTYNVEVIDSAVKDTKSGSGQYIELRMRVASGKYENRQIWDRLNFLNTSAKAQSIGQQQLKALCDACGIQGDLQDTVQLHGHLVNATVTVEKGNEQYGPSNSIKRYSNYGAIDQSEAPAANGASRPWQRNN